MTLHFQAPSLPVSSLQVIRRDPLRSPESLLCQSRREVCKLVYRRVREGLVGGLREFLTNHAPMAERQVLLQDLQANYSNLNADYEKTFEDAAGVCVYPDEVEDYRAKFLKSVQCYWELLYTRDFQKVNVPNLASSLEADARLRELTARFHRTFTPHMWSIDCDNASEHDLQRPPLRVFRGEPPRRTNETYANILNVINGAGPCAAKTVTFSCYGQRAVSSMKEKAIMFNLVENLRNVRVLELGYGCDDSILREISRFCSHVSSLTLAGLHVTDKGIRYLCGYLDLPSRLAIARSVTSECDDDDTADLNVLEYEPADVCESLKVLDITGALHITEKGIKTVLLHFKNLNRLKCNDAYFWRILYSMSKVSEFQNFTLPLKIFELGSSGNGGVLLKTAARVFPYIEELVFFNFDSLSDSSFASFDKWNCFGRLSTIRLNNVAFPDLVRLLKEIGRQVLNLEIDNFSIDDILVSKIDLATVCSLAPNLVQFTLSMCHCCYGEEVLDKQFRMRSLAKLVIKGVTCENPNVVQNLVSICPELEVFHLFSKLDRPTSPLDFMHMQNFLIQQLADGVVDPPLPPPGGPVDNNAASHSERPLNDGQMSKIFKRNGLKRLKDFIATVIDHEMGLLDLSETT